MPLHIGKGRDVSTAITDIIDYVKNPQKTDHGKFIYGYECDSRIVDAEFLLSKRQYANLTGRSQGSDDVIAYHLRQAFKPGEVTPEEANQIGRELAMKLTKGNNASLTALREEYAGLLEQKRKAYSAYKQARADMKELQNVRANVEYLLEIHRDQEPQRETQRSPR